MAFYEVVFEDGSYSTAQYDSDEEAVAAVTAHHERAKAGQPALLSAPDTGVKATRIKKLIKYDGDPGSATEDQALSADVAKSEVNAALAASTTDGVTDMRALAAAIRDISNPLVESGPHESNFKAEGKEIKLPFVKED